MRGQRNCDQSIRTRRMKYHRNQERIEEEGMISRVKERSNIKMRMEK